MTDLLIPNRDVDLRLNEIRSTDDLVERAKLAERLVKAAHTAWETSRDERDQALAALGVVHKMKAVKVYQAAEVERIIYYRAKARFDTKRKIDSRFHDLDTALAVALDLNDAPQRYKAAEKEAQELRNEAIKALAAGDKEAGRDPLSNEDIADLVDLSAERISQIKTGKSN